MAMQGPKILKYLVVGGPTGTPPHWLCRAHYSLAGLGMAGVVGIRELVDNKRQLLLALFYKYCLFEF